MKIISPDAHEVERLKARVAVLEQLLEAHEQAVIQQSESLEQALEQVQARAAALAQSQAALQNQSSILQSILNSAGDGIAVTDASGRFILANPAAERIMGTQLTDIRYDRWTEHYECYRPDQATPYGPDELPLARAIRGEEVNEAEEFTRSPERPEGIWLSVTARPLRDAGGKVNGGVAIFRDISARKRAEQAVRDSEALYHSLVECLPLNIFRKDREGRFTFGNSLFCKTLGRPLEDLLGKTDFHFFPSHLAEKYRADDHRVMAAGIPFEDVEEHQKPTGEKIYVQVIKAPVRDAAGQIVGIQGIFWDVTDRKRAEEKLKTTAADLQRSNQELEQFAYIASHDLQEPLRMVGSYCQLLQRRYKGKLDADADEFIHFAVDGAVRMQTLINDLLAYSRVGTKGKAFQTVSCESALERALHNLKVAIEESGAQVTHDPLPTVMGDSTQLVQLFQNLIGNALKFRGAGTPSIHLSADRNGVMWQFGVRDNGIGIAPQDHERVFIIFHRLHSRDEYPGTGIGLAICKRIVERHGGRIWVESRRGEGATFYFTLPYQPTPVAPEKP